MERNDRPNEQNRHEDWLDTELGSSKRAPEPLQAEQVTRPSFMSRMFPGFIGGVAGALLTGAIALPFIDQAPDVTSNTNVTSDGTPVQTSSNIKDTSVTNAVAAAQPAVVTVNNFAASGFSNEAVEAGVGSGVIYKKKWLGLHRHEPSRRQWRRPSDRHVQRRFNC